MMHPCYIFILVHFQALQLVSTIHPSAKLDNATHHSIVDLIVSQ